MPTVKEIIALIVQADVKGAIRELDKVEKQTAKTFDKSKADKWGAGLQKGGAAAVGFAALAGGALLAFARVADERDKAEVKFQNTLKNAPQLAKANVQAFRDLAQQVQRTTVVDDEAALSVIALLGQYKATESQIHTLTPLVVDFARKMDIDLVTATKAVGKSIDGNTSGLRRMGIGVDQTAAKVDPFRATVDALAGSVGGFSRDELETFSGKLANMRNQLGEVAEALGTGVIDALSPVIEGLGTMSGKFSELDPKVGSTVGKFATFGIAALGAAGAASFVTGKVLDASDRFGRLSAALPRTGAALSKFGGYAAVAAGAIAGLLILQQVGQIAEGSGPRFDTAAKSIERLGETGKATGLVADTFGKDFENLRSAILRLGDESLWDKVSHGAETVGEAFDSIPGREKADDVRDLEHGLIAIDDQLAKMVNEGNAEGAAAAMAFLVDQAEAQGVALPQVEHAFDSYTQALKDAETAGEVTAGSAATLGAGLDDLGDEAAGAAAETVGLITRLKQLEGSSANAFARIRGQIGAQLAAGDAADQFADAMKALRGETDEAASSMGSAGGATQTAAAAAFEAADKQRTLRDAMQAVDDTARDLIDSQEDLADATQGVAAAQAALDRVLSGDPSKTAGAEEELSDAKRELEGVNLSVADAEENLAKVRKEAAARPGEIAAAEAKLRDMRSDGESTAVEIGRAESELADLRDEAAGAANDIRRAELAVENARDRSETATQDAAEAQRVYDGTVAGFPATAAEAVTAEDNLRAAKDKQEAATRRVREANDAASDAALGLRRSQADLAGQLDASAGATARAANVLPPYEQRARAAANAALELATQMANVTGAAEGSVEWLHAYMGTLQTLAAQNPALRGVLNGLIGDVQRLITTAVLNAVTARTNRTFGELFGAGFNAPRRQGGGDVHGGGTYLVGETGPELLTMGRGTNGHVSRGAGGGGNTITINATSLDPRTTAKLVKDAIIDLRNRGFAV